MCAREGPRKEGSLQCYGHYGCTVTEVIFKGRAVPVDSVANNAEEFVSWWLEGCEKGKGVRRVDPFCHFCISPGYTV